MTCLDRTEDVNGIRMDLDGSHIAISVGIYRAPVVTREQNASRGDDVIVKPLSL